MKVKVFSAATEKSLEKKVNEFLETGVDVVDVKIAGGFGFMAIMVSYNER